MKILSYILTGAITFVPRLWIEDYTLTNPVWWTVVLLCAVCKAYGYIEGLTEKEKQL